MHQLSLTQLDSSFHRFPDHPSYIDQCLEMAISKVASYHSISDFGNDLNNVNAYKHLKELEEPQNIALLDNQTLNKGDYIKAWKCIADGKLFTEHTAAGEATRLKLGTKYLINIQRDLSLKKITDLINQEKGTSISEEFFRNKSLCSPSELLPLSLGVRHMLQYSYDICNFAKSFGYDHREVLSKQKMLIVLNEATYGSIIDEFIKHRFYGFSRFNILFMIQKPYHGINFKHNEIFYDRFAPKRLHNHGHIAIEQTMNNEIFYINENRCQSYLSSDQFGDILEDMEMKISYNIEDLDYLTGSIDNEGLALALKKSKEDCHMVMEVLPNNPDSPQKGGMAAFDPILEKDVIIESFQLNGIDNQDIRFLNKNVNYYPKPYIAWEKVKEYGLNMHISVKDGFIYFQPVIGDINFLVKTAIFTRKNASPIKAWKSPVTTPLAISCMHMQDKQKGFRDYARSFLD